MSIPPDLRKQVEEFLEEFRACSRPRIDLSDYWKNDDFIQRSGITSEEIKKILLEDLSFDHYTHGPEEELNTTYSSGIVYKFKYPWENYKIYIKLKTFFSKGMKMAICLSFHD